MGAVDAYLAALPADQRNLLSHLYAVAQMNCSEAEQTTKYNLPCLVYKGQGCVALIANKKFLSYYPFCNLESLGVSVEGFEATKGSIHFSVSKPLPDDVVTALVRARLAQIDGRS